MFNNICLGQVTAVADIRDVGCDEGCFYFKILKSCTVLFELGDELPGGLPLDVSGTGLALAPHK